MFSKLNQYHLLLFVTKTRFQCLSSFYALFENVHVINSITCTFGLLILSGTDLCNNGHTYKSVEVLGFVGPVYKHNIYWNTSGNDGTAYSYNTCIKVLQCVIVRNK